MLRLASWLGNIVYIHVVGMSSVHSVSNRLTKAYRIYAHPIRVHASSTVVMLKPKPVFYPVVALGIAQPVLQQPYDSYACKYPTSIILEKSLKQQSL
jgi:hypothetical protein